jgi:hypothetical protein
MEAGANWRYLVLPFPGVKIVQADSDGPFNGVYVSVYIKFDGSDTPAAMAELRRFIAGLE